jgi:SAM-dependent methyltransferase
MDVDATSRGIPETRRYVACIRCGSLMDVMGTPRPAGGDNGATLTDETPSVKFHLEVGAGIESFASLLSLLEKAVGMESGNRLQHGRLLDVGTGFGFMVSMAQARGWQAVGVEPSSMGRVGSDILDVPILSDPLERAGIPGDAFDAIVSCEVIEHVADPGEFVATLGRYLASSGILVLTTPNGEVIRGRDTTEREWYEAPSPGDHLTLFSPLGMETLLRACGFEDVRLLLMGGTSGRKHIIAVAARHRGSLPPGFDWEVICQEGRQIALGYLYELAQRRELAGKRDILYRGVLFRIIRMLINQGASSAVSPHLDKLDGLLSSMHVLDRDIEVATTFDAYVPLSRLPWGILLPTWHALLKLHWSVP